ncbi:MBL fold metallo-hydrolase [Cohnella pontilimi]|uniref:MBL fold metallo-hydrolase n=1 Tax=Cohnella pontilimi TaxID=2564100 RepID=A0A4U0FGD9_9BACL|nr:Rieske 2Fe-2S domain-containing protein [Cohnella pontilimi]TJY43930.1 MBL fold metallo-hydrolase [Cohnella pontilimi]
MIITALGHAGFCVETEKAIIIMDPWVSTNGAFDSAWFQYPCNHHMASFIQEKLQNTSKQRYIYISHEHKDHFDPSFLRSLQTNDFTFVIGRFRRTALYDALLKCECKEIIRCTDGQTIQIPGGTITLYIDDSEIERDSAILVKADGQSFLNQNDCKIFDRLSEIMTEHGTIDVYTAQYSGATWHPVCYDYPKKNYTAISIRKRSSKFEAVARAIETLNPRVYFTSAGPPCFLDPLLFHINFERINIFPRGQVFLDYLKKRLKKTPTKFSEPMPVDQLDAATGEWVFLSSERVTEKNYEAYIRAYAARFEPLFRSRRDLVNAQELPTLFENLKTALVEKLQKLTLRDRVKIPLYFRLSDYLERMIRVDFQANKVEDAAEILEENYYSISTPSWEIARVLDGRLTWEDFTLTFRMQLKRDPDVYHVVIHGFLTMEPDDMNAFCSKVLNSEANCERVLVEAGGRRYSINRYCPHAGADLTGGWIEKDRFLVCPRHRWMFDLEEDGRCLNSDASIDAVEVEDN